MKMKYTSLLLAGLLMSGNVLADAVKGMEIANERKARDTGWGDSVATMSMILKNAQGESSTRQMRLKSLEVDGDGDKGLTIFDEPRDVKGTAFLNHSHTTEPDDQWLYLPALKRVKRISSRNKSGPFMGSEFAYEDLSSFELEKYKFNYIQDDMVDGEPVFLLEQIPTDKNSGYTKQLVWLDKVHYRPLKVEFYDRKSALLKTLTFSEYQVYEDQYWRAHKMLMVNHQSGKSTILNTEEMAFRNGLDDGDFSKNTLKRVR
ncbi:putative Outer membrane lipoprotein-sorting protein [Vibrio nigripulchritudo MADA3029]|uniref:Outer membrane lipoprotein-sorting protein n=1 Tax=Vibrio nigripulchritudo SOn1 TaxID=1238450 RepID=A0AAV2VJE6_9VIBR|nr:outer membrane lipoprotein-sorting protein [Vibrio nigripulchritudo ATCC 27043]KJY79776.1 membrane protein [Vibrio nigripulchritudo]CCN45690.1 putative Outer membrane lipoprotein-sorting protein [Vibrio nigripulchritudo MADA3020]CCN52967.1 putative Outer membrane lipoprotein-sorting protein [Vibrio nigripulchritudo MADA3021]CCN61597.1 putative Outer membrane lipoprotein-sorting protein [Vibrio nigripulchritudo MADA3029]CCN68872.1 putative Outer membrane lipoprotein-sorting protein [Vibrio n